MKQIQLRRSLFAGGLAVTLSVGAQNSQNAPQQIPVFRTGIEMVRVDVYPRKDDKVVEGLTRDDFQLTEDGVRQNIETFEFISIETERELVPLDPRSASEAKRMAADPHNRVFVFYLDTYKIDFEGGARARGPLLDFLQRSMGPRDLFAWMTPKHSPEFLEFTRVTQDLATLMTVAKPWGQMNLPVEDPNEMELQACEPPPKNLNAPPWALNALVLRMRDLEFHTDIRELIIRLGALREERKNLVILGERWQNEFGLPPRLQTSLPVVPAFRAQRGRGSFVPPSSPTTEVRRKCDQVRQYLDRKDLGEMTRALPELARRYNVALYFVSLAPQTLFNFSLARTFAEETDGRSMVSNDVFGSLHQVLDHQTGFYMLGYRSTAGEAGKKERTVRVKTTKSGVDLDVRRVYQPPPPEFIGSRNSPPVLVERTDVQKAIDRLPPARDDIDVVIHAIRRAEAVEITVELVPRVASADPWRSGGSATVVLRDEAGAEITKAASPFAAGERSARVRVPSESLRVAVRVSARITHSDGTTLSDSTALEPFQPAPIGDALFYRAGSLPRLPYLPAAHLAFGRTERVRIEWPVTGDLVDPTVRLLNAAGDALATDVTLAVVDGVIRADLRLASLAPGEYVVEAAGRVQAKPVRRLVAIRVTR